MHRKHQNLHHYHHDQQPTTNNSISNNQSHRLNPNTTNGLPTITEEAVQEDFREEEEDEVEDEDEVEADFTEVEEEGVRRKKYRS